MGGKSSAPPPPDYGPIAAANEAAAKIQAEVAREQLDWAKKQYFLDKEVTDEVVARALAIQDQNTEAAIADRARYEGTYQPIEDINVREAQRLAEERDWRAQAYAPLEDRMLSEAMDYASGTRMATEVGRAQADVGQQFDAARRASLQSLESYGVNPSATRFAALDRGIRAQEAAAKAGAATVARDRVEATGRALEDRALGYRTQQDAIGRAVSSEAINVGRGMPGQVAGAYNTALQGGNQAANTTLAQTASGAQTMGTAPQYYGLQSNFLNNWGNTLNMGYQNQLAAYQANQSQSSGIGSILGTVAGAAAYKFLADGGPVEGGPVPEDASPTGGRAIDDVPARLTAGEFVIPKDVVSWKGEEFFHRLIAKTEGDRQRLTSESGAVPDVAYVRHDDPTFVSRSGEVMAATGGMIPPRPAFRPAASAGAAIPAGGGMPARPAFRPAAMPQALPASAPVTRDAAMAAYQARLAAARERTGGGTTGALYDMYSAEQTQRRQALENLKVREAEMAALRSEFDDYRSRYNPSTLRAPAYSDAGGGGDGGWGGMSGDYGGPSNDTGAGNSVGDAGLGGGDNDGSAGPGGPT